MTLGDFEQLVLLAILHLGEEAYGSRIVETIEEKSGRTISRSALYVTFDRLESKGHLTSSLRHPTEERGGRMRRYVKVAPAGLEALRESRNVLEGMWRGLDATFGET